MSDIARIGLRHDDLSDWESGNPTLVDDETVIIDDVGMIARGDGSAFNTSYDEVGTLGATDMIFGKYVGEIYFRPGEVVDISASHPGLCLTDFAISTDIAATNYPDFVPWLRSQRARYLEGLAGGTAEFSGNASGSVITLDDNAANNALLEALDREAKAHVEEMGGDNEDWITITWDGTEYEIADAGSGVPDIDTNTREITVVGTPTTGAGNLTVYPHRIAGSSTTARVYSWRGRSLIGASYDGVISGFRRRDQMQGHWHDIWGANGAAQNESNYNQARETSSGYTELDSNDAVRDAQSDGTNGTPRTGATSHGMDVGSHIYQHVGRYVV